MALTAPPYVPMPPFHHLTPLPTVLPTVGPAHGDVFFLPSTFNHLPSSFQMNIYERINPSDVERVMKSLNWNDSYFHNEQQSTRILLDFQHRARKAADTKRCIDIDAEFVKRGQLPKSMLKNIPDPHHVTLCMEVCELQHREMMCQEILKSNESIPRISHDTQTLIQFPDSGDKPPYANQIQITGHYLDVERARFRLRDYSIAWVLFPIREMRRGLNLSYSNLLQFIEAKTQSGIIKYSNVNFKVHSPGECHYLEDYSPALRVMGRLSDMQSIADCCEQLLNMLFDEGHIPLCHSVVEFPRYMYKFADREAFKLITRSLLTHTSSFVRILDPGDLFNCIAIHIRGQLKNVIAAHGIIMGLLPVYLVFDATDKDFRQPAPSHDKCYNLDFQDTELNVSARMDVSQLESTIALDDDVSLRVVELRTNEMNITNLYKAYFLVLNEQRQGKMPIMDSPSYEISKTPYKRELAVLSKDIMRGCRAAPLPCLPASSLEASISSPTITSSTSEYSRTTSKSFDTLCNEIDEEEDERSSFEQIVGYLNEIGGINGHEHEHGHGHGHGNWNGNGHTIGNGRQAFIRDGSFDVSDTASGSSDRTNVARGAWTHDRYRDRDCHNHNQHSHQHRTHQNGQNQRYNKPPRRDNREMGEYREQINNQIQVDGNGIGIGNGAFNQSYHHPLQMERRYQYRRNNHTFNGMGQSSGRGFRNVYYNDSRRY